MSAVKLKVNGLVYQGWEAVKIQRGITQISGIFSLTLSNENFRISRGDACQLLVDETVVIDGFVDAAPIAYDSKSSSLSIEGRDCTADLVDCHVEKAFHWANAGTLYAGVKQLVKPFNISVINEVPDNYTFASMKAELGDTVFDALDAAARVRGRLLMTDGNGNLRITTAGKAGRTLDSLELGRNVKAAHFTPSNIDRFSTYTVYGQTKGNLFSSADASYQKRASSNDKQVMRHRPYVHLSSEAIDNAAAKRMADWEASVRRGRSEPLVYTVIGWYSADGQLWTPNKTVSVVDNYLNIDTHLLIASVVFSLDENGQRTEITLMPVEAFALTQLPEPTEDATGGILG